MGMFRPLKPSKTPPAAKTDIETELRDFVGKAPPRHSRDGEGEVTAGLISDGLQRVVGAPLAEIGRMITELTQLRDHLQHESERVQNEIARVDSEIAGYTQTSEAAVQSIRAIDQAVGAFKSATKSSS